MKIALFGGAGRTGTLLVRQALDRGHEVVALVRMAAKLSIADVGLTVIEGDATNAGDVVQVIEGADAVVSMIAPMPGGTEGMMKTVSENIIAAMRQHGARRLIVTSGAAVRDPNDTPGVLHRLMGRVVKIVGPKMLSDMESAVAVIRDSDLDWTVVRAPVLTDGPRTGLYRVGYVSADLGMRVSRADFADFVLTELADCRWVRKMPAVSG